MLRKSKDENSVATRVNLREFKELLKNDSKAKKKLEFVSKVLKDLKEVDNCSIESLFYNKINV